MTALSFAEMASMFPESGGAYTFAKKVLTVRAAFGMGWVLWFAYIVAGVLYALGFAEYAVLAVSELLHATTGSEPAWLHKRGNAERSCRGRDGRLQPAWPLGRAEGGGKARDHRQARAVCRAAGD